MDTWEVLHVHYILLTKPVHFIKDLQQLLYAISKFKMEEDTPAALIEV